MPVNKVLYLTYDGLTDFLGQSQVLPYMTGLVKEGYDITLISFEKKKAFSVAADKVNEICKENFIKWHPLTYTKHPPVLSTLKDLWKLRRLVVKLHKRENFSIIHCRSYITSLVGLWAKRKFGTRFVFDMRGFWADERIDGKLWNLNNPLYWLIYKFFKAKEREFFRNSDYIISLTANAKDEILNICRGRQTAPIEIIPCCVDLDLFDYNKVDAATIEKKRKEFGISPAATVLSYIGSISGWYMLSEMLSFFKQWREQDPDAIFMFITGGNANDILHEASQLNIPHEKLRILQGVREEMSVLIACSDYSVFFIRPLYSKKASSPTKQGEIMAMGKPIICNTKIGDTDAVITKYNAGVLLNGFSEQEFKSAIRTIRSTHFNRQMIRTGAEEFYSLKNGIEKYKSIYQKIQPAIVMSTVPGKVGLENV